MVYQKVITRKVRAPYIFRAPYVLSGKYKKSTVKLPKPEQGTVSSRLTKSKGKRGNPKGLSHAITSNVYRIPKYIKLYEDDIDEDDSITLIF